jgi:uncharacterized membrane protein YeaQ/YmgE (transglycosylase-associated protein family)
MSASLVIAILFSGLVTGGLARLAVPGPDPMPLWLTVSIGLTGSIVGAVLARVLFNDNGYVVSFASLGFAIGLVLAYRRFVQHRPLWGAEALHFPERGLGVGRYRERLQAMGIDPSARVPDAAAARKARLLAMLEELHRAGVLDDEELMAKRTAVEREL